MAAGITQSYSPKTINDFEIIRFEKLTVILRAIKYPITVPAMFEIISFMEQTVKHHIRQTKFINDILHLIPRTYIVKGS